MITAYISKNALKKNLDFLKEKSRTDVMPVLKANAYGHGLVKIAKICRKLKSEYIGVSTIDEAVRLRQSGDKGKILCWLYDVKSDQVREAVSRDIEVAIFDQTHIPIISNSLPKTTRAKVHLYVDTGMTRNGVPYEHAVAAAKEIVADPKFDLVGVMSHICCSSKKKHKYAENQLSLFRKLRSTLAEEGIKPELYHIAATDTLLNYDVSDFPLVRSATGLFGLDTHQNENLTSVLTLTSKIIQMKQIEKGTGIGYEREYVSDRQQTVLVVPVGYADFFPLVSGEKMEVTVNGTKRKVLGMENMDLILVEGESTDRLGDEVRFLGDKKKGDVSGVDFAKQCGTNILNILTHLGDRVKYRYVI